MSGLVGGDGFAGFRPVGNEVVDYEVAYAVGVFEGGDVGGVFGDLGGGEALGGGEVVGLLVVVAGGAEDEDAVEVDFSGFGEPGEGLEGSGVFHAADGVGSVAVSLVGEPVVGPLVHELAVPVGAGGEVVGAEDEGGTVGGAVGFGGEVGLAVVGDGGGVEERGVFGEVEGPGDEGGVETVDVAVVAEAGLAGLLVGGGFSEGDVAGGPEAALGRGGVGDLAGVDLVGEVAIDDVVGPDGGAEGAHVGIDAADAGDEEVGVGEVETGVETEGHNGGGGAGGANAGEEAEDSGGGVEAEVVVGGGQGQDGGEVFALDPVLVLAGGVAGVGSLLEHVDDDDFDLDGPGGRWRRGLREGAGGGCQQEERGKEAHR